MILHDVYKASNRIRYSFDQRVMNDGCIELRLGKNIRAIENKGHTRIYIYNGEKKIYDIQLTTLQDIYEAMIKAINKYDAVKNEGQYVIVIKDDSDKMKYYTGFRKNSTESFKYAKKYTSERYAQQSLSRLKTNYGVIAEIRYE